MAYKINYINENGDVVSSTVVDSLDGELGDKVLNVMQWPEGHPKRVVDFDIVEGTYAPNPKVRGGVIFTPLPN